MNTTITAKRFYSLITTALFGAISFSFAALPATAHSFEVPQVTVKFGDLDVSHSQGAAVLYNRIRAAAKNVCSPLASADLDAKKQLRDCVNDTIEDAVIKINEPALIAVYNAKIGKTLPTRVASFPNR